jgi:hypothetical protein
MADEQPLAAPASPPPEEAGLRTGAEMPFLDHLEEEITPNELAGKVGALEKDVQRVLEDLVTLGLLVRDGD